MNKLTRKKELETKKNKTDKLSIIMTIVALSTFTILSITYPKETKEFANEIKDLIQKGPNELLKLKIK